MWVAEREMPVICTQNIHDLLTTPVSAVSVEQHFCQKDHEQADSGGTCHFPDKIDKVAKLQPFDEYQIEMMYKTEDAHIQGIRRPAHAFMAGFNITLLGCFLRY